MKVSYSMLTKQNEQRTDSESKNNYKYINVKLLQSPTNSHSNSLLAPLCYAWKYTCPEVFRRRKCQISTVALPISAILHQTETRQPRIPILRNGQLIMNMIHSLKMTRKQPTFNQTPRTKNFTISKRTLYALRSWNSARPLLLQYSSACAKYSATLILIAQLMGCVSPAPISDQNDIKKTHLFYQN